MTRSRLLFFPILALLVGCAPKGVETEYGKISTPRSAKSVNGATVLARMFEARGAKVTSARRLTPRLFEKADCIVWIPDDFDLPRDAVAEWFERWLAARPNRTLIYVARDYDAAVDYWEDVKNDFESEADRREARSRLSEARQRHAAARPETPEETAGGWFSLRAGSPRDVKPLDSDFGWLEGLDVEKTDLHLGHYPVFDEWYVPVLQTEKGGIPLLTTETGWFAARTFRGDGQIIVVANGSFLLNYPLVNHEHRKLASRLIEASRTDGRVVFVESDRLGLMIAEKDRPARTAWDVVTHSPFNWMLGQFIALGVIFCFRRWPIFGRPRVLAGESLTDFGGHVAALGRLLRQNGNRALAEEELRKYHEELGRPASASSAEAPGRRHSSP
jgi:hypothetical protein